MAGYPASLSQHGPCRSLADIAAGLSADRNRLLLRWLEADAYGDDDIAADCQRRIAAIDRRLRALARAIG